MKIDVWSDIACPFCYIGKHHLQNAISQLASSDDIHIHYRTFLLDASAPKQPQKTIYQLLAHKYGMSIDDVKASTQRIAEQGKQIGLTFNFDVLQSVNTIDGHRLIHLAAESDLAPEMTEALFKAFFTDALNIADHHVLITLAKKAGLAPDAVEAMLNSQRYLAEIEEDKQQIQQLGIRSVPFFVFNDQYAISGAQPVTVFKALLEELQHE